MLASSKFLRYDFPMTPIDNPFSISETIFYVIVNTVPYILFVVYTFRNHLRFSRKVNVVFFIIANLLICSLSVIRMSFDAFPSAAGDVLISLLQIGLIFIVIKDHPGKLIFVVFSLTNFANMAIIISKFLESRFFPNEALLRYHFTYTIFLLFVEVIMLPLLYLFVYRAVCPEDNESLGLSLTEHAQEISHMWLSLWLIPALFYIVWVYHFYFGEKSALLKAMDPIDTGYIVLVDIGSVLIYRTILNLVSTQEKYLRLQAENQSFSMREVQYDSLNRQIEETRRTRHDLRHHVNILKIIRETGDMETLDDLIARYEQQYSIQPLRFCENDTVNSILFYYFNRTKNSEVDFDVICNIPEEISIDRIELSVLFGNLLENAIEATIKKETGRFIRVRSSFSGECLSLIISNSYEIMPEQHGEVFRSKKHSGNGIGIESVKNISLHYHGTSSFTFQDGVFTASVLLYPDTTDSKTGR